MVDLQVKLAWQGDLATFARDTHLKIARGARIAAETQVARAKLAFRGAVRQAGLGDRVANSVRVNIYPKSAANHTHAPAVFVFTRTPEIIFAFSQGVTIRGHNGIWLAIPTENVPRVSRSSNQEGRGGRFQSRASPREVEKQFGDLIFLPGRGGQILGFVDARRTKKGRAARATERSRKRELILMFVFVRQVTLRKRLDWQRITSDLGAGWVDLFGSEIAKALKD